MRRRLEGPGSEARLRSLQSAFRAVARGFERRPSLLTSLWRLRSVVAVGLLSGAALAVMIDPIAGDARRLGSISLALRHHAAQHGCDAARLVGLAPARRNAPGYWRHLDADADGVACEPWRG